MESLSLREKIGQMLCVGFQDDEPGDSFLHVNEQVRRGVTELHAGAVIFFARNVQRDSEPTDLVRTRDFVAELQSLARVPLFVAVDQEGGRVARFGAPFTPLPSAQVFGQVGDTTSAMKAGHITGTELRAVGVNFNFAPVADINSNAANPVIGNRSFGATPEIVAPLSTHFAMGQNEAGVLSCLKHFPGHGDTDVGQSFRPADPFAHPRKLMDERELVPFVMGIGHRSGDYDGAYFVSRTGRVPAFRRRFRSPILTDLLRHDLGFDGLIVTDCLQMKAVADTWGTPQAAVMAAKAGADILLVCHKWDSQRATFDALVAAAISGELPMERVDESVRRILAAKAALPTGDAPPLSVVGCAEHQAFARSVYEAAGQNAPGIHRPPDSRRRVLGVGATERLPCHAV